LGKIWERGQQGGITRPINQEQLFKNLCEVSEALTRHGIKHWLSHGTMLGAYRDQELIPWDDDVDLGLDYSQRHLISPFEEEMREKGYFVPRDGQEGMPHYDTVLIRDGEKIECWWFKKKGDWYIYDEPRCGNALKHSAKYYDELQDFKFKGIPFKIPNHIEEYLIMMYSEDWNKPQKGRKYNNQG
jgi:phosphorylcholine metabolism protein LicD